MKSINIYVVIHAASLTEKCKNTIQFKSSLDDIEEMKNTFIFKDN
jgi:hypothetical protein